MTMNTATGILLVNLGSPASYSEDDVRAFLDEFLMDERVLDYPYLVRRLIVSAFILPVRPATSAAAYKSIWWEAGSPLILISQRLQMALQAQLAVPVELGMRYGSPSIHSALERLLARDVKRIFLVPLYPHYAMSTYETVIAATRQELVNLSAQVHLEAVPPFYNHRDYIQALVKSARPYLPQDFDHLLFSYHGVPERHLHKSDPTRRHCLSSGQCCSIASLAHITCYRHQTLETTRLFAESGVLPQGMKHSQAFQSRLGRDRWLEPNTGSEIQRLAQEEGVKKLAVICPAFVSDCLETLEEIGIRGKKTFLDAGGEQFKLIPCLNDHPAWVAALASWCRRAVKGQAPLKP